MYEYLNCIRHDTMLGGTVSCPPPILVLYIDSKLTTPLFTSPLHANMPHPPFQLSQQFVTFLLGFTSTRFF